MSEADPKTAATGQREQRGTLPAGTRLRSYEVISVLGQGSFGITYYARDSQLNRDVAIKEYLPVSLALRDDGTMVMPRSTDLVEEFLVGREQFLNEARTLAKLGHAPAIVRVHDFLEANGTAYMVMGLARGETLHRHLRDDGSLASAAIEQLLFPLLDGLEEVHATGFLHRDIKPSNIILDAKGNPTLIDFGASRIAVAGHTRDLTAIFTPGYAAAEQFTSAKQGPWTDIYGLSATIYHAITGKIPPSAFDRMLDDEYVPLKTLQLPDFSAGLLAGIDAGLRVRASSRPQSIAGWRSILRQTTPSTFDVAATEVLRRPKPGPEIPTLALARSTTAPSASLVGGFWIGALRKMIWAGLAALVVMVGSLAYFNKSLLLGTSVQSLTAEELTLALEERRKADAAAAEMKKLEIEAQQKADADAKAKQAADVELEKAKKQRAIAEEQLTKLKADIAARQKVANTLREENAAAAQQALDEAAKRNKANSDIAVLRKADEEAKQKAAADAAANQAADEEAQRKAEAEAAAFRKAEEDAATKAAVEAEIKRLADEALVKAQTESQQAEKLATRQKAELEAKQKPGADTAAVVDDGTKAKAEAAADAQKKAAEAAETALRLTSVDRQHMQVALSALGFDTRGSDGALGPRSREMILGWQKARNQPPTGFLTGPQQQALLREAAAAVSKYDNEQKKVEEDKRKSDEEAKKKIEETNAKPATIPTTKADVWKARYILNEQKSLVICQKSSGLYVFELINGALTVTNQNRRVFSIAVPADGIISQEFQAPPGGQVAMKGNVITRELEIVNAHSGCQWSLIPER